MMMEATLMMRLDVARAGMLVRVFRKVLRGLWGVPPFVWEINHFGDGHIDGLATLKLRRHRTESERDLSQRLFSYFPDNNTFSPFFGQKSFKLFLFWSLKSWRESSET